jgi:hypothetical protein
MGILLTKINEKINHLKNEYQNNQNIQHQGIKGGFNENELSDLIKEVIPTKYIITKGIIENSSGNQSNETDIVIYDNDVLPYYIKNDLSFVPIEAVKYIFEVKSTLNSTDLKTTIDKFSNFKKMGGHSPTVLFAYLSDIQGNELTRYKKNDINFFTNPKISVLCISNKCYCYKQVEEYYLKDFYTNKEWLKLYTESDNSLDINKTFEIMDEAFNNEMLEKLNREQFALAIKAMIQIDTHKQNINKYSLIMNGVDFNEIKFKIHKWIQIKVNETINNIEMLSFLSGISNTLSKESFGKYLLNDKNGTSKVCGVCYEDMWGNISAEDFDENGLNYDTNQFSFSYQSSSESNSHKMTFKSTR